MNEVRIARLQTATGPDGLLITPEPLPAPGPGQVALDMRALGLNRAEAMFARGQYLVTPNLPSRIGIEGAGIVRALGEGVQGLEIGQRVAAVSAIDVARVGLAGDVAVVDTTMVLPDLASLSDAELAAFWIAYLTAHIGLSVEGQLAAGQTVLVTAASSSVGLAAIQMAKSIGARVIATTRNEAKVEPLLKAGADRVVVTGRDDLTACGEAIDVAFDAIAGQSVETLASIMNNGGRIVIYGALSGEGLTPFPLFPAVAKNLQISAFHAGFHGLANKARREAAVASLRQGVEKGTLRPVIDRTFEFEDLPNAYRHLESGQQIGKIVVRL